MSLISRPRGIRYIELYKLDYVSILGGINFVELEIGQDDNTNDGNIQYVHGDIEGTNL